MKPKDWHPYKVAPDVAAMSWTRRFGYQAAAMARRHALAFHDTRCRDYWREVARVIDNETTKRGSRR